MGIERVRAYYDRVPETSRFSSPEGELEFFRTKIVLERHLPPAPARVLDLGGAVGHYAFWLAGMGHRVSLVDAAEAHVAAATARNAAAAQRLESVAVGDARRLELPSSTFDAVLGMGPLYHLLARQDRIAALREMERVLVPGGLLVTAYISRFASLVDGYCSAYMDDPAFDAMVDRDLGTGEHLPPDHDRYFTEAYFHRPEEIGTEILEAGLTDFELLAVEGPLWTVPDLGVRLADGARRRQLLASISRLEREPSLMGYSAHLLAVAHKRQEAPRGHERDARAACTGAIEIVPILEAHIPGFHRALYAVCRERKYLARFEAPPLESTRAFVLHNIGQGVPQVVALDGETVVGWCDISPSAKDVFRHCGTLGMGILAPYRHRGTGTRLLAAALTRAREAGIERVELEVYESNAAAIALYRKMGFREEGRKIRSCRIDGRYDNDILMVLFL
jgi:ribosomal protein S18 acetylase RimI-like enzyme/SAM-dependent methyltransferase